MDFPPLPAAVLATFPPPRLPKPPPQLPKPQTPPEPPPPRVVVGSAEVETGRGRAAARGSEQLAVMVPYPPALPVLPPPPPTPPPPPIASPFKPRRWRQRERH